MNRRELLKQIAILTGSAVPGAEAILSGCTNKGQVTSVSDPDLQDK